MPPAKSAARKKGMAHWRIVMLGLILALLAYENWQKPPSGPELERLFRGVDGCLVLTGAGENGQTLKHQADRAASRFWPCSTFKIMNALVALETGAAPDPDFTLPWDGQTRAVPEWNHDLTLRQAFASSAVWYFQETARRIGPENMARWLKAAGYGNQDISAGLDRFWLPGGSLTISAQEQVDFLTRLQRGELPFSARSQELVREMMRQEATGKGALYGKTGSALDNGQPSLGWFVGWVESQGRAQVFAVNVSQGGGRKAKELTLELLRARGLL